MPRPAERSRRERREPRPGIDRAWLWRILLALAIVALIGLIAKAAMMAFSGAGRRIDPRSAAAAGFLVSAPSAPVRQRGGQQLTERAASRC